MRILRSALDIPDNRQRKIFSKPQLDDLKNSILSYSLLHAPVVQPQGDRYTLVAGERRLRAIDAIHAEGSFFYHNLETFEPGSIPVVLLSEALSTITRAEIELTENVERVELPWQDRIAALNYIHSLRKEANPRQSAMDTAKELVAEGNTMTATSTAATPAAVKTTQMEILKANVIAQHLDKPEIAKARNATEAYNLIIANEERKFHAELIRRGETKTGSVEVRHGSLLEIMPKLDSSQFDTILGDPPYGINVGSGGFRSRTVHAHNYDDSPDAAKELLQCILVEGFRVCKPRANIFIFCDIDLFGWLKDTAARAGWDPFRTPISWGKSDSEGMAPWGREGFRRTIEWIFFARKGQKGLFHSPIDYLRHNRVGRNEREYGPEKPITLLKELLAASTLPGDYVLDPCCGSGSTLIAARDLKMRALGIELDEKAYNLSLTKINSEEDLNVGGEHQPAINQL